MSAAAPWPCWPRSPSRATAGRRCCTPSPAAGGAALAIVVTRQQPEIADASGNAGAWAVLLVLAGAALACVAVVALTSLAGAERWRLPARATRIALAAAAAVVILVGALAGPSLASDAWDQFTSSNATVSQSDPAARLGNLGGNRHNIWDAALDAYRSEHLHGIGAGSFEFWWSRTSGPNYEFLRDAHNLYLEQLAELGLIGLALILALLASLAYPALRARRDLANPAELGANAALIAAFTVFLLHAGVDWMWEETALSALALTGLAIAAAASTPHPAAAPAALALAHPDRPRGRGRRTHPTTRPRLHLPRPRQQEAVRAGDLQTASSDALDAIDAEPWAADPYTQAALVFQTRGQLARAAADAQAATQKNPPTHATGSSSPASKPNAGTPKQHSKPSKSQAAPTPRSRHPTALTQMTTALVHDYLLTMRGAERSFAAIADCWPQAPIYTLLYDELGTGGAFRRRAVNTSYLQRFPARQSRFRHLLPMFPRAVERLPLDSHSLVISSSSAFAHGVHTRPDAAHICYCYTPFRYAWIEEARQSTRLHAWRVPSCGPAFGGYEAGTSPPRVVSATTLRSRGSQESGSSESTGATRAWCTHP